MDALRGGYLRVAWLRSAGFDATPIFGGLSLALLSGGAILYEPSWLYPILVVDLWVLGYHHVISTFTRLCFDKASYSERRWMIVHLVPVIAASTILLAWAVGIWAIVTIYFYWQWWHYTRQSWGISRAYRRADPGARYEDGWLDQAIFYAMPVYGILLRSSQDHAHFIFMSPTSRAMPWRRCSHCGRRGGSWRSGTAALPSPIRSTCSPILRSSARAMSGYRTSPWAG